MPELHPGLMLIVVGLVVAVLPRRLGAPATLVAAAAALAMVWGLDDDARVTYDFYGYDLVLLAVDGLARPFAMVFSALGVLASLYGWTLMNRVERAAGLATIGAGLGVVLAGDLLTLFLFWEFKVITVVVLIAARGRTPSSAAAQRYLFVHLAGPTRDLVELLQRAIGHVVKVIFRSDDSNGSIGDVVRQLLELHARACQPGVADPAKLAKWMVKFRFVDQDFFEVDPVRYAPGLGDTGLAVYRREVAAKSAGADTFAAKYAAQRLAVLDRDVPALIAMLGGDLTSAYQYERVAKAMLELDQTDDALQWALDGIERTSGWQVAKLYDLASELLSQRGDTAAVLALHQQQHVRMPSASTYSQLRRSAQAVSRWDELRPGARTVLGTRDPGGLVDVLLDDGEADAAWALAHEAGEQGHMGEQRWKRLAEVRATTHPAEAMALWWELVDAVLTTADKAAYQAAVRYVKAARKAAEAADAMLDFEIRLAGLRETNRRRPSFMAMLDKAGLA